MSSESSPIKPSSALLRAEEKARESHQWAVEIIAKHFREGLEGVFEHAFVERRFGEFALRSDPVYTTLLQGMNDDGIARAMVGTWMVAHTLATQTRFWLEQAIVDILIKRASMAPAPRPRVYSLAMLADGWYQSGKSLWDVGEHWREELHGRRGWRPLIQEKALDEIERIVGEEERQFESVDPTRRRAWSDGRSYVLTEAADDAALTRAASSLGGTARPISVRCNLLFIEPERPDSEPRAWAIRYINPTTFNQPATIKAERVNLLRLRAYLAQEKPFRAPGKIRVVAADLLPRANRDDSGRAFAHFSPRTRWGAEELWEFLNVPFEAVTAGIREAGVLMRGELRGELRTLLSAGQ